MIRFAGRWRSWRACSRHVEGRSGQRDRPIRRPFGGCSRRVRESDTGHPRGGGRGIAQDAPQCANTSDGAVLPWSLS